MAAALSAAREGAEVLLLEQNEKLGKKVYITGKGRCNVTNACSVEDLFSHAVSNGKFLYSAFHRFTNSDLMALLEKNGCPLCPHVTAMASLYWTALLDAMVPSEGAAEVFAGLKARGLTIGIGTDMTAYVQFRKLEKLGLLPCVDFVVTSEESGAEKPEKALFELCRKKAGAEAQECLFVGDNPKKDVRGALAAGMQACHFSPDRAAEGEGYVVIRKLKELLQIVP